MSSAASEKGLQTFQAQDALAQQLSMQLQLQQAEAERQVWLGAPWCADMVCFMWLGVSCRTGFVLCLSGLPGAAATCGAADDAGWRGVWMRWQRL